MTRLMTRPGRRRRRPREDAGAPSADAKNSYSRDTIRSLKEVNMRKMIMMAIAGFIWKKIQAKMNGQTSGSVRRY